MTREEAIADIRDNIKPVVSGISLDMAIEALKQQPCEDCISRQAVLDAIEVKAWEFCDYLIREGRNDEQQPVSHFADNLRECVGEDLLPVTPKEKTGKWKVQHTNLSHLPSDTIVTCLECGHTKSRIDGEILNFCPKCGTRMVSE